MARVDLTQIEGFDVLNRKLKLLPDGVKRTEVNKILRRLARPIVLLYRQQLPKDSGVLQRSVSVKTVSKKEANGNPAVDVLPRKVGRRIDPFYRFMVVSKGTKLGSRRRGSRRTKATVVPMARDAAAQRIPNNLVETGAEQVSKLVQKQIDRLSR